MKKEIDKKKSWYYNKDAEPPQKSINKRADIKQIEKFKEISVLQLLFIYTLVRYILNCFLFLQFRQFPPDGKKHRSKAGNSADKVGNWFGGEYAVGAHSEHTWQQDCQRNDDDYFSENREKDRFFGFAQTDENRLSGELERHHKESEKV